MNPPPRPRGRPRYEPTLKDKGTVQAMLSYGVPQDDVAAVLGIDAKTLRKHFPAEIRSAAIHANATVKQALFHTATSWMTKDDKGKITGHPSKEAVTAAIFWDKTRGGAIETQHIRTQGTVKTDATVEHKGEVKLGFDPVGRSADLLDQLARRLAGGGEPAAGLADDGKK
jgi:hypothetical protein